MRESAPMERVDDLVGVSSVQRPRVEPLAPGRYKLQFTVAQETYRKLRRAQDLLRHRVPSGDPAEIFDRALTLLLFDLERKKFAATSRSRASLNRGKSSRHIPADVRRAVWARDGGRCRFVGPAGRCTETGLLEFPRAVHGTRRTFSTVSDATCLEWFRMP
jgi:hypothetical protein